MKKNYLKIIPAILLLILVINCSEEEPDPANQAPNISDQSFSIDENSSDGTTVGNIAASDPDGDEVALTITDGNASGAFALNASGTLSVSTSSALDFETTPAFTLTVEASDGELSSSATVTVSLNDLDENNGSSNNQPIIEAQTFTLDENSANGTAVGLVIASDPDDDDLTYSINDGNSSDAFAINNAGELTVANSAALDFETTPSFALTVEVSDGTLSASATVTVNLTDVDESMGEPGDNEVYLDNELYALTSGVIWDYGMLDFEGQGNFTHYEYGFTAIDQGTLDLRKDGPFDEVYYTSEDNIFEINASLYTEGSTFQAGTYDFEDFESSVTGNVFYFWLEVEKSESEWAYFEANGGTITVTVEGTAYMLTFDLTLTGETNEGEATATINGNYSFTSDPYSWIDEKIELSDPFFTVDPGTGFNNIFRSAWTGSKLWAISSLYNDGGGSSDTPQLLLEIDPATGNVLQSLTPDRPIWSLDYANGILWDISDFTTDNPLQQYSVDDGSYIGSWGGSSTYDIDYYWTFDGTDYYGNANYDCDGANCQDLVKVTTNESYEVPFPDANTPYDLMFGGDHFWASNGEGIIIKLDNSFEQVKVYQISNAEELFGEAQYSIDIPMQLEYINGELWIMDRNNNFYKTGIQ